MTLTGIVAEVARKSQACEVEARIHNCMAHEHGPHSLSGV